MENLSSYIDHTLLKSTATHEDFEKLCLEAKQHQFASVCVPPNMVSFVDKQVKDSHVKVCTVVGFPLGYNLQATKVFETDRAIAQGADEIDMVANLILFKNKDFKACELDIEEVVRVASGRTVKVILETCHLDLNEVADLSKLCKEAGAHFVKTSTGFASGGATVDAVKTMRESVGPNFGVKASGGIRDYETAKKMIDAGATRLGTSQSLAIIGQAKANEGAY